MNGDLSGKVAASDIEKLKDKKNPPAFEPGFEPGESGGSSDWDGFDSDFLGGGEDILGGGSSGGSDIGGASMPGMSDGFGSPGGGGSIFGNPSSGGAFGDPWSGGQSSLFGGSTFGQNQTTQEIKPSASDKFFEWAGDSGSALLSILGQALKTFSTRNYDDWALFSKNLILSGGLLCGCGVASILIGIATHLKAFRLTGIPAHLFLTGALTAVIGALVMLGCAALIAATAEKYNLDSGYAGEIPSETGVSNASIEDDLGFAFENTGFGGFGGSDEPEEPIEAEDLFGGLGEPGEESFEEPELEAPSFEETAPSFDDSLGDRVSSIGRAPLINREVLFNTLKPMFPLNTEGFDTRTEVEPGSDRFYYLEALALKALAAASGKADFTELDSGLESAVETMYTYELKIKRIPGLKKLDDINREMEAYFKDSVNDIGVGCKTDINGDFYMCTITKGTSAVVTFGDIFKRQDVCGFYLNKKNLLPICVGVGIDGNPVLVDAKMFDTMLIAGRPRSGKSWYILSIILSMCAFNTPEDIQVLVIDPKKSNMMKTLGNMPHVCGVVDDSNIIGVLDGIIKGEAERRKKLLADNHCDKLFDLWDLGIKVPVLYIVIDEYMTVMANLDDAGSKVFKEQIKVIISQLPSLGIRLIIVPHRSKGVVDVTARMNISFSAAVRAENQVIKETLDIQKWDIPLNNPGDTALKMQGMGDPMFVSGLAVTTSDTDNAKMIEAIAKIFYQMGVDIPDMSGIGPGYTRNTDEILENLKAKKNTEYVQSDIDNLPDGDWE